MHVCEYRDCDAAFSIRSNMRRHEQLHEDRPRFSCKMCPVECSRVRDLVRHCQRAHGVSGSPPRGPRRQRPRTPKFPRRRLHFSPRKDERKVISSTALGPVKSLRIRRVSHQKTPERTVVNYHTPKETVTKETTEMILEHPILSPDQASVVSEVALDNQLEQPSKETADILDLDAGDTRLSVDVIARTPRPVIAQKKIRINDTPPSEGEDSSEEEEPIPDPSTKAAATATQTLRQQVDPCLLDPTTTGGRRLRAIEVSEVFHGGELVNRRINYTFFECS